MYLYDKDKGTDPEVVKIIEIDGVLVLVRFCIDGGVHLNGMIERGKKEKISYLWSKIDRPCVPSEKTARE